MKKITPAIIITTKMRNARILTSNTQLLHRNELIEQPGQTFFSDTSHGFSRIELFPGKRTNFK